MKASPIPSQMHLSHRMRIRREVTNLLPAGWNEDDLEAHFSLMPTRYWQHVTPRDVLWHLTAIRAFLDRERDRPSERKAVLVRSRHFHERGFTEVIFVSRDRHGLIADIAGAMADWNLNIVSAHAFTRDDRLAVDIFHVQDSGKRHVRKKSALGRMSDQLERALKNGDGGGHGDRAQDLKRAHGKWKPIVSRAEIHWNNSVSQRYSLLRVQAPDSPGLLHRILKTISDTNFRVHMARIRTVRHMAIDEFRITTRGGEKVQYEERLDRLKEQLYKALEQEGSPKQAENG